MPAETLEYRFVEEGLSEIRSAFSDVEGDLEDVSEAEEDAASGMEEMEDHASDAGESIERNMGDAETAVADVAERAETSAASLEESFEEASQEVIQDIDGMGESLTDFTQQDAGVDLGAQLGEAGGTGGLVTGGLLALKGADSLGLNRLDDAVSSIEDATKKVQAELNSLRSEFDEARAPLVVMSEASEDAGRAADDLAQDLRDVEGKDIRGVGGGSGTDDPPMSGNLADLADDGDDAEGSLLGLGSAAGMASRKLGIAGASALGLASAVGAVATAAGVGTKQMADFAAEVSETGQQLVVAEEQSGVTAERVHELFLIAERLDADVDLDAIRDAFKELALRTEEAREGTGEAREAFDRLGISMDQLRGRSTAEVFDLVRRKAAELTAQQRILTLEQIAGGEAGERLARVFGLQAKEYQRLKESVAAESLASSEIEQMDEMRTQYTRMQQDLRDVKQNLAVTFGPPAISILETFTQTLQGTVDALNNAPEVGGKLGITSESIGTPETPDVTFGPTERVQFGDNTQDGGGDVPKPVQEMKKALSQLETDIAVAREKFRRDLIPKEDMLSQIVGFRERAGDQLLRLVQESPELIPQAKVDRAIQRLKGARSRLGQFSLQDAYGSVGGASQVPTTNPLEEASGAGEGPIDIPSLVGPSIKELDRMEREARESMSTLQTIFDEGGENAAQALTRAVQQASRELTADLFGAIGALFGGGSGLQETQLRLQKRRLRKQKRQLRESLRDREISHEVYALRVKAIQQRLSQTSQKLAEETESAWRNSFETLGSFVKDVVQGVVQELVSAMTTALALRAIIATVPGVGQVGGASTIAGLFSGALGGFTTNADGGVYSGPTAAIVGEYAGASSNQEIITPEKKMQSVFAKTLAGAGMGGAITVHVEGETRTDGRDLVTSYDTTKRAQRRKGHSSR